MVEIGITRSGHMALYQWGRRVAVNEQQLRAFVEEHYERPWPPSILLDRNAIERLREYIAH